MPQGQALDAGKWTVELAVDTNCRHRSYLDKAAPHGQRAKLDGAGVQRAADRPIHRLEDAVVCHLRHECKR